MQQQTDTTIITENEQKVLDELDKDEPTNAPELIGLFPDHSRTTVYDWLESLRERGYVRKNKLSARTVLWFRAE